MPADVSRSQWVGLLTGSVPFLLLVLTALGVGWLLGVFSLLLGPVLIVGVFWIGGGFYDGADDRYHRAAAFFGFLATTYMARGIAAAGERACAAQSLPGLGGVELGYCWRQSLLLPTAMPSLGIATGGRLVSVPVLSFLVATALTGLAGYMYAERYEDGRIA